MGTTLLEDPGSNPPRRAKTTLVDSSAGMTRLVTPPGAEENSEPATKTTAASSDPVVGWLVVIVGPGKGMAVPLGLGMNAIGRGQSNRVVLGFGDDKISSEDHFRIAYDPESREFHLVPSKGTNLLYVNNKAVLSPVALGPMTDIRLGATTLRFVPFCGPSWDWADA